MLAAIRSAAPLALVLSLGLTFPAAAGPPPGRPAAPAAATALARPVADDPGPVPATITAHALDGSDELLLVQVPGVEGGGLAASVRSAGTGPGTYALAFPAAGPGELWVRRDPAAAGRPLEGELFLEGPGYELAPARHLRFTVSPPIATPDGKAQAATRARFGEAFAQRLRSKRGSPFYGFAAERVLGRARPVLPAAGSRAGELERLMETTTGMRSLQEAIQADRPLFLGGARAKEEVPLSALKGPPLAAHPFPDKLKALGRPVPEEPLARLAPAAFWYARVATLPLLLRLVDQLDGWLSPALQVLERQGEDRGLVDRALLQLGLERGPLARALGPEVVEAVAVVGSDPYLREGSDLTLLVQVKRRALLDAALAAQLQFRLAGDGGAAAFATLDVGGVVVRVQRSADEAVAQYRATLGDVELVSNSPGAIRRVIEAATGRAPRLADEPDFRYLLARDGNAGGGLAFLGDRFIAEVVGPRQKVLEARRQLALAELLTPGYTALLYGWLNGHAPRDADELIRSGLLAPAELAHRSGEPIAFHPARGARSTLGTPGALTPLLDWQSLERVTRGEEAAYHRFAAAYQERWQQYFNPALVRFALGGGRLTVELRVLPLINGTDYRRMVELVGAVRLLAPPLGAGARVVFGLGADAGLRRELDRLARDNPLSERLTIDWLGDWVFVGADDDPALAEAMRSLEPKVAPPPPGASAPHRRDELSQLLAAPVPPDGGAFTLGPSGVSDPARGSAVVERWPVLPAPGSPVERLLAQVAGFRSEIAFDVEPRVAGAPPLTGLRVRLALTLREAAAR